MSALTPRSGDQGGGERGAPSSRIAGGAELLEPAVVATRDALEALAGTLAGAPRVALDLESDGMFAYRAQVCTIQIAAKGKITVVDTLAAPLGPLTEVLGSRGPVKIVHDVAFDARMLAGAGVFLGNVHDTSIAARLLGRTATGLASLARTELGLEIDKGLQHHDWRERPLAEAHLAYLARDVAHLDALADLLWNELRTRGIEEEVLEETRYRIANAAAAAGEPASPVAYADTKGFDRLRGIERAVFRRLWAVRESAAAELDVPAPRLIATEALLAIARSQPRTREALAKARLPRERFDRLAPALLEAIAHGIEDQDLPASEREELDVPRPSREAIARRRAREAALTAWRKAEAKRRNVDEQVVLPGHCLKTLAEAEAVAVEAIVMSPGFGACRAHYAAEIASALGRAQGLTTERR